MKKENIVSALSYLWILFFLPLVLIPDSKFGRFHANQALLNLIIGIVMTVISRIIPFVGFIFNIISIIYIVWGIFFALKGEEKPLPFIGHITIIK